MGNTKEIRLLGNKVEIAPRQNDSLKGISVGEKMSFRFYDGVYEGTNMLFVEPKKGNPTPRECDITGRRLAELFGMPIVFILEPGPTYERQRLLNKGVYFIMSENYAHLPMLIAMEKTTNRKKAIRLSPVAQYLLLYHLQVESLEDLSAREIAPLVPYSYESVTLGLICLVDVGLCQMQQRGQRSKVVHFPLKSMGLWQESQAYVSSPVIKRIYSDAIHTERQFPTCGINALAHYGRLNPDSENIIVMTAKEYNYQKNSDVFENLNFYDGNVMIEVWKYPVIALIGDNPQYVDPLSLALSLRDDKDPRVEKEVERIINNVIWKD